MVDHTDNEILRALQSNARISNAEIGRRLNLVPSAVFERIKKLEKKGVIRGFETKLDKKLLGLSVTAFIFVKTSNYGGDTHKFLAEMPEVLEVHDVAGDDSYLIKVCVRDNENLSELIRERIRQIPDIVSTKTTIVLQTEKESTTLQLPAREE